MSVTLKTYCTNPPVIEAVVSGKLDARDYEQFTACFETMIEKHGKVSLLLRLSNFEGWTAGALWEDLKFDFKHFSDIKKLAIVGDESWEKNLATFSKPFTMAKVAFFPAEQLDGAARWVTQEIE